MTDLLKRLEEMAAEIEDFSRQHTKEEADKIAADLREACRIIKEQREALGVARDALRPFRDAEPELRWSNTFHGGPLRDLRDDDIVRLDWFSGPDGERSTVDFVTAANFRQAAAAHQLLTDLPGDES